MALTVAAKGDFSLLPRFNESDFEGYELYLGLLDESTTQSITQKIGALPPHIRIVSIHTPTRVLVNGRVYPFDLGQPDPIGSVSLQALEQTMQLAVQCKATVVVVHGASHNAFLESKEEAMRRLSERIRPLLDRNEIDNDMDKTAVKLCFETDVLWHNLYYSRRSLLTTTEDFALLKNLLSGKLKITADFEHLSITFHFLQFIAHCGGEQEFLKKYSEITQRKFELDAQKFIKENYDELQAGFKEYLSSFFQVFHDEIEHIHITGSDCCNYLFHPQTSLPLLGEHLPLGIKATGLTEENVSDKIDYPLVASLLHTLPEKKDIKVVMELWRTDPVEFIKASRESKKFLEEHLKSGENMGLKQG